MSSGLTLVIVPFVFSTNVPSISTLHPSPFIVTIDITTPNYDANDPKSS